MKKQLIGELGCAESCSSVQSLSDTEDSCTITAASPEVKNQGDCEARADLNNAQPDGSTSAAAQYSTTWMRDDPLSLGHIRVGSLPAIVRTAGIDKRIEKTFNNSLSKFKPAYVDLNIPKYGDHPGMLCVMLFDIDVGNAPLAWHDARFPFYPAWFCGKWSAVGLNRAHIIIKLKFPVRKKRGRALRLYEAVYSEIARRLEEQGLVVDGMIKPITKNPDSTIWDTVMADPDREWSLYELALLLELDPEGKDDRCEDRIAINRDYHMFDNSFEVEKRNCSTFDNVRFQAYAFKAKCSREQELQTFCYLKACEHNLTFAVGLPDSELRTISNSIAKWTWGNYYGQGLKPKNRGAAADIIPVGASISEKQSIGATYSATKKREKTFKLVQDAKLELLTSNTPITKKAVSRLTKLSIKTVRAAWERRPLVSEEAKPFEGKVERSQADVRLDVAGVDGSLVEGSGASSISSPSQLILTARNAEQSALRGELGAIRVTYPVRSPWSGQDLPVHIDGKEILSRPALSKGKKKIKSKRKMRKTHKKGGQYYHHQQPGLVPSTPPSQFRPPKGDQERGNNIFELFSKAGTKTFSETAKCYYDHSINKPVHSTPPALPELRITEFLMMRARRAEAEVTPAHNV
ncbi:MAG: hypothetical protein ACXIU7_10970 [Roseinatronobacter sp.]